MVPAFLWKPKGYQAEISTIFSKVECIRAIHGMTDILLVGEKSLGLIRVQETTVVCSVEVGVYKEAICPVTIAGEVKVWPEHTAISALDYIRRPQIFAIFYDATLRKQF